MFLLISCSVSPIWHNGKTWNSFPPWTSMRMTLLTWRRSGRMPSTRWKTLIVWITKGRREREGEGDGGGGGGEEGRGTKEERRKGGKEERRKRERIGEGDTEGRENAGGWRGRGKAGEERGGKRRGERGKGRRTPLRIHDPSGCRRRQCLLKGDRKVQSPQSSHMAYPITQEACLQAQTLQESTFSFGKAYRGMTTLSLGRASFVQPLLPNVSCHWCSRGDIFHIVIGSVSVFLSGPLPAVHILQ